MTRQGWLRLWIFFFLLAPVAEARVFNFGNESFSAYIRGAWGPSVPNTANSNSSGNNVTLDSTHQSLLGGEFGFAYATGLANLRLGLEVLRPRELKDSPGKSAAGAELYNLTSEISVLIPKAILEITLNRTASTRFFIGAGGGFASFAGRNSYTFTSASTFALQDFYEDLRGSAVVYEGLAGFEGLLTDATTFVLEGGYRSLRFNEIKHNRDVTGFQGTTVKGDLARNMDGSNRTLNLSNYFFGLSLRFWLH